MDCIHVPNNNMPQLECNEITSHYPSKAFDAITDVMGEDCLGSLGGVLEDDDLGYNEETISKFI